MALCLAAAVSVSPVVASAEPLSESSVKTQDEQAETKEAEPQVTDETGTVTQAENLKAEVQEEKSTEEYVRKIIRDRKIIFHEKSCRRCTQSGKNT